MALAFVEYAGTDGGFARFRVDIGTNRYYAYAVGDGRTAERAGDFTVMRDVTRTSPLIRVPESALGHAVLAVPTDAFSKGSPDMQIVSYKEQMLAPAFSDIVRVGPADAASDDFRPDITFAADTLPIRVVPNRAPRSYSTAMFWEALVSLLPTILPAVANIVGGLLGPKPAAAPAPSAGQIVQNAAQPDTLKLLTELLQKLLAAGGTPAAAAAPEPAEAKALAMTRLSEAQVFPAALLTALPALMPLLEKVLTPETIKTVVQTADPNRLLGTISQSILDFAKIGLQAEEQQLEHLRAILPSTGPAADELLKDASFSLSAETLSAEPSYRRVDVVRIHFADLTLQPVAGRPQASFRADRDLAFPLAIETPKPIPNARLVVRVKDAASLRVLARRAYGIPLAGGGRLDVVPTIPLEAVSRLPVGHDYLVHVALLWRSRNGERLGTTVSQLVTLVGEYAFDRVEQSTEVIPLNDVELHRDFWHKAWQDTFDEKRRQFVFNCRYVYGLDPKKTTNAQMETLADTKTDDARRATGTLGSGMVMSLFRLNRLLERVSGQRPLTDAELTGLTTQDFLDRFALAARTQVRFRGRVGDSAALWVFPEVKLQDVVLRHAEVVNDAGHVLRFTEHRVRFPMPVIAHFIGVASQ